MTKPNRHRHPEAHKYIKIVRWSEEDNCFIGSCPPIIGECCHADTEAEVMDQLVVIVDEWIDIFQKDGDKLPSPTNGQFTGRLNIRIDPNLHRAVALRAKAQGNTLTHHIEQTLARSLTA